MYSTVCNSENDLYLKSNVLFVTVKMIYLKSNVLFVFPFEKIKKCMCLTLIASSYLLGITC